MVADLSERLVAGLLEARINQLTERRARLRRIEFLDQSPHGIPVGIDKAHIAGASRSAADRLGVCRSELVGSIRVGPVSPRIEEPHPRGPAARSPARPGLPTLQPAGLRDQQDLFISVLDRLRRQVGGRIALADEGNQVHGPARRVEFAP